LRAGSFSFAISVGINNASVPIADKAVDVLVYAAPLRYQFAGSESCNSG
jgi:hypothetical protein